MDFSEVIGHSHLKNHLETTAKHKRVPHAQLFVGRAGSGILPMAIAYAKTLLCEGHPEGSEAAQRCAQKVAKLSHPDLHFVFPVNKRNSNHKYPISKDFSEEWRAFVQKQPYGSVFDWLQSLGLENKQGNISVHEAQDIVKSLALKSFEGGYKVMIIWMADKMNTECANKVLKIIEEPPQKTVLLLLTEDEEQLLGTIRSRCQTLRFPLLPEADIAEALILHQQVDQKMAYSISRKAQGDFAKALQLLNQNAEEQLFEQWFVDWVRTAYTARGKKKAINSLIQWGESMAGQGRETQKAFLGYCLEMFRQGMLANYQAKPLVYFEASATSFSIESFAPFVHGRNIIPITKSLEEAYYHIERNANGKLVFIDLSIQLTRLIHALEV